jgi:hypothetical protein
MAMTNNQNSKNREGIADGGESQGLGPMSLEPGAGCWELRDRQYERPSNTSRSSALPSLRFLHSCIFVLDEKNIAYSWRDRVAVRAPYCQEFL